MAIDVKDLSFEDLESLLNDDEEEPSTQGNAEAEQTESQGTEEKPAEETTTTEVPVDQTKAFAKRLKESTDKARQEEREAIAKQFGYESFEAMQKKRENDLYDEKGLDPDQVAPVVEEIVKQRLENDPRMKELEKFRKQEIQEFGKRELAEITKLTGGRVTNLSQLSKEVIDLWQQRGSLKSAYLELEGERLINDMRSEQSKGTTTHLKSPDGDNVDASGKRHLTNEEKDYWRFFNPNMTDEELNKKMV